HPTTPRTQWLAPAGSRCHAVEEFAVRSAALKRTRNSDDGAQCHSMNIAGPSAIGSKRHPELNSRATTVANILVSASPTQACASRPNGEYSVRGGIPRAKRHGSNRSGSGKTVGSRGVSRTGDRGPHPAGIV